MQAQKKQAGEHDAMEMTEAILLTIFTAATPLLLAGMGELITERSGVLNLGVEGMMIVGAIYCKIPNPWRYLATRLAYYYSTEQKE